MNQDLPIALEDYHALPSHDEDVTASSALLAELRTRVTTRPLHARSGDEEGAIQSVRRIIPIVRRLLSRYPRAKRFECVAIPIIDLLIRSRMNRWHRWVADGSIKQDDQRLAFRGELADLQAALRRACSLLEAVRSKRDLVQDDLFMGIRMNTSERALITSRLALDGFDAEIQGAFPKCQRVLDAEKEELSNQKKVPTNVAGLALSGGGIRSATFSLGVLKVLAERGLFSQLHYLSTVSGGGYLGTFISSYLNDSKRDITEIFDRDASTDTAPVRHLRNHSKYLLDGGIKNQFRTVMLMAVGILTNLLTLLPIVAVFALVTLGLAKLGLWNPGSWTNDPSGYRFDLSSYCVLAFVIGIASALAAHFIICPLLAFSRGFTNQPRWRNIRRFGEWAANCITALTLIIGGLACVPFAFLAFDTVFGGHGLITKIQEGTSSLTSLSTGIIPFIAGPLAVKFSHRKLLGPLLGFLFLLSGPVFFLCLYIVTTQLLFNVDSWSPWVTALSVLGVLLFWAALNLNAFSPHQFYRRQLVKCYLAKGLTSDQGLQVERRSDPLPLTNIGKGQAPYHLINGAINLPSSPEKELRGRKSDFFLFSKRYVGSPSTGYIETGQLESSDSSFDVGSAMAVSGAAFSSNMGVLNFDRYRFLLTLFNVRLGYWIKNPAKMKSPAKGSSSRFSLTAPLDKPGPLYLIKEMFGLMTEKARYVNISDGGHIENLGVYELIRRKSKFIISVDGECDPNRFFDGLIKLIRYARIDFGANIEVDPADLAKDEDGYSPKHGLFGKIIYADGSIGWLLYLKLSLTGNEPPDILDYQREQPAFPHQTTLDQIYSEKQFEAYRALGQHVAEELFHKDILENRDEFLPARSANGDTDLKKWFEALAMHLLPDNDAVFAPDPTNLDGARIGISVSDSELSDPAESMAFTETISKKLIGLGAAVVFGHDWQEEGLMMSIAKFALDDQLLNRRDSDRKVIVNRVQIGNPTRPPEDLDEKIRELIDMEEVAGTLHEVREKLAQMCDARICLGGALKKRLPGGDTGFTGLIPGVMEEAFLAAQAGQTVLISGCLGGVSAWMAARLRGETPAAAPHYLVDDSARKEAAKLQLPTTAEEFADRLKDLITKPCQENDTLLGLHHRLWETTTLDAAIAVMLEILVITREFEGD